MADSILAEFESLQFSVLPCDMSTAAAAIREQGRRWGKRYTVDRGAPRDIRQIYCSTNGPAKMPAIDTGMLLSEVGINRERKTLFVSSVRDGYSSMIHCVSRVIPGDHLSVRVSRPEVQFPIAEFKLVSAFEVKRVVRAMRGDDGWEFFMRGEPAAFEDASLYEVRRKRDRLTPEIISLYLMRLGYGSLGRDYWIDQGASAHLLCEESFGVAKLS
jgi:hypothetical protein